MPGIKMPPLASISTVPSGTGVTPDRRDALINDEDITMLDGPQRWVNR